MKAGVQTIKMVSDATVSHIKVDDQGKRISGMVMMELEEGVELLYVQVLLKCRESSVNTLLPNDRILVRQDHKVLEGLLSIHNIPFLLPLNEATYPFHGEYANRHLFLDICAYGVIEEEQQQYHFEYDISNESSWYHKISHVIQEQILTLKKEKTADLVFQDEEQAVPYLSITQSSREIGQGAFKLNLNFHEQLIPSHVGVQIQCHEKYISLKEGIKKNLVASTKIQYFTHLNTYDNALISITDKMLPPHLYVSNPNIYWTIHLSFIHEDGEETRYYDEINVVAKVS